MEAHAAAPADPFAAALAQAQQSLQAGRLDAAEAAYRGILAEDAGHPAALNMLGVCRAHVGDFDQAIALLQRAVERNPGGASAAANLGNALAAVGRNSEALAMFERAAQKMPRSTPIHIKRGAMLARLGRHQDALQSCDDALALAPDLAAAWTQKAFALHALGRDGEALQAIDQAQIPAGLDANQLALRGAVLKALGRAEEALPCFERVLSSEPAHLGALVDRASLLDDAGRLEEALAGYERALAIDPVHVQAYCNRGVVLHRLGRYEEAIESFERACALDPESPAVVLGRAGPLSDSGRDAEALRDLDAIIARDPGHALAHYNRALCLLRSGELTEGWREYEWRWRLVANAARADRAFRPETLGLDLRGQSVLIETEQGLGDTLQFCRFASVLAQRGANVTLQVQQPLRSLLNGLRGVERVVQEGKSLPEHDIVVPLLSLPRLLGTTLDSIPADIPYVSVAPQGAARMRQFLGPDEARLRIGLVWSGNRNHKNDTLRSMALAAFAPMIEDCPSDSVQWVSVQNEVRPSDQPTLRALPVLDLSARLADFADTAELVATLDLVISIDSAVAHLAGAMGRPVWVLLPYAPDYRWLRDRTDSLWYPSARLFRQRAPGDWAGVIRDVAAELKTFTLPLEKAGPGRSDVHAFNRD